MSDVAAYRVLFAVQGGMWTGYSQYQYTLWIKYRNSEYQTCPDLRRPLGTEGLIKKFPNVKGF